MTDKNVLILGAGFGGINVFNSLQRLLKKSDSVKITLLDEQNYSLFSPLLHEVAVGVLLPYNIITPVRNLYDSKTHKFVQTHIDEIDLNNSRS